MRTRAGGRARNGATDLLWLAALAVYAAIYWFVVIRSEMKSGRMEPPLSAFDRKVAELLLDGRKVGVLFLAVHEIKTTSGPIYRRLMRTVSKLVWRVVFDSSSLPPGDGYYDDGDEVSELLSDTFIYCGITYHLTWLDKGKAEMERARFGFEDW